MPSEGKEAKVQEKQQQAAHENKTKHNLARDTDVWKNPNSYKHLPSWLQQSSSSDRKRQRTNYYLPRLLAAKSKTAVVQPMTKWPLREIWVTHRRAGIGFKPSGMWRRYQFTQRTIQNLQVTTLLAGTIPTLPDCQVTLQTTRYFKASLTLWPWNWTFK